MPEPDQRSSRSNGKPPTALMVSYNAMTAKKRLELKRIGYGLLLFSFALPTITSVGLSVLGSSARLPAVTWLFCGVGMIIGLSLSWPEMGIYLLSRLPSAVARLLPTKLTSAIHRPERRSGD